MIVQVFDMAGNQVEPTAAHLEQAHALAGVCDHGVGMLDQCDACCPPVEVTPVGGQETMS